MVYEHDDQPMNDPIRYRRALAPYAHTRILAAWAAGSRLHGIMDAHSDLDLKILTASTRDDILLGRTGRIISLHDPDITLLDPIALHHGVVKGSPNMLEWLDMPDDSLLADTGVFATLRRARPHPAGLPTLRMLDGNIHANLHRLTGKPPAGRRLWKLQAETLRLAWAADTLARTGIMRARCDPEWRAILHAIRQGQSAPFDLRHEIGRLERERPTPCLPDTADTSRFTDATLGLMHGLVEQWTRTMSMSALCARLG